jgi:hypothetical protein
MFALLITLICVTKHMFFIKEMGYVKKKYIDVTIIMWQLGYHSINPGFEYALYESQKHRSWKGQAKLFLCYENFI